MKINDKIQCAIFASITSILAQISIPLPFTTVPMTMLIFAVALTGIILGAKKGFISIMIYILLGVIGIPVFSGMRGGISIIIGPTGGFLIGCPFMAFVIGYVREHSNSFIYIMLSMVVGLAIVYLGGVIVFYLITESSIYKSVLICVLPFIIVDFLKLVLATTIGISVYKRINLNINNQ